MLKYLVFLGVIIQTSGAAYYALETLRGRVRPNRVTWLLWGIAPLIGSAAAFTEGVTFATVPVLMAGINPILIFTASFFNKNAYWKSGLFDYLCGLLSVLALFFWWISGEALVAIYFAIAADFFAAIPTLTKSWKEPKSENSWVYICSTLATATSFFAMESFSSVELAFPIYLVILNVLILFILYRGRFCKR